MNYVFDLLVELLAHALWLHMMNAKARDLLPTCVHWYGTLSEFSPRCLAKLAALVGESSSG
eukprot:CAMPEP_0203776662 /NCGR_PEP_ID=MMETSP0099_2-20121227/6887_1 /ASSEMBLY_ACC=CAM_ASM_000209 /TAXON_ID=96639 /ORGANISM=" , Strain NY0313808BC1" /LENGTH=60 /DNA_ID=CAMNT_0050675727 /DNA_START=389 /DNA_END=568 /DNA_ORIENTATION=+